MKTLIRTLFANITTSIISTMILGALGTATLVASCEAGPLRNLFRRMRENREERRDNRAGRRLACNTPHYEPNDNARPQVAPPFVVPPKKPETDAFGDEIKKVSANEATQPLIGKASSANANGSQYVTYYSNSRGSRLRGSRCSSGNCR